jgi:transposase
MSDYKPTSRRSFNDEFKNQIVQLFHNGKRKCEIVREYDLAPLLLDRWIHQAKKTGSFNDLTPNFLPH